MPRLGFLMPQKINLLVTFEFRQRLTDFFEDEMATGTVKWFNATKGYGFIQPDGGGADVFVHVSAVQQAGLSDLQEKQKISYELIMDPRKNKTSAGNLKLA